MSQKDYDMNPRWYVVHTYSGYENKVKKDLFVPYEEVSKDEKKTIFKILIR